jgi:hypothetical protein
MFMVCASGGVVKRGVYVLLGLLLCAITVHAQPEPNPYPPDSLLKGILDFHEPTAIRGRIPYIDKKKQNIWVDWAQLSVERPSFEKGWTLVPGEWTIAVQPLNQAQFYDLQQMAKGTVLELVIQVDQEGVRRILFFHELARLPKVYTKLSISGIVPEK